MIKYFKTFPMHIYYNNIIKAIIVRGKLTSSPKMPDNPFAIGVIILHDDLMTFLSFTIKY